MSVCQSCCAVVTRGVCRDRLSLPWSASPTAQPQEWEERLLSAALSSAEEFTAQGPGCGTSGEAWEGKTCHEVKGGRQTSLELPHAPACQSFKGEYSVFQERIDSKAQNLMGLRKKFFVTLFLIKAFLKPHTTKCWAAKGLEPLPSSLQTLMEMTLQTRKNKGFWHAEAFCLWVLCWLNDLVKKGSVQNKICRWMLCLIFARLWVRHLLGLKVHLAFPYLHGLKMQRKDMLRNFCKVILTGNNSLQNLKTINKRELATGTLSTQNALKFRSQEITCFSLCIFNWHTSFTSLFNYSVLKFQFNLDTRLKVKYKSKAYQNYLTKYDWLKLTSSVHWSDVLLKLSRQTHIEYLLHFHGLKWKKERTFCAAPSTEQTLQSVPCALGSLCAAAHQAPTLAATAEWHFQALGGLFWVLLVLVKMRHLEAICRVRKRRHWAFHTQFQHWDWISRSI